MLSDHWPCHTLQKWLLFLRAFILCFAAQNLTGGKVIFSLQPFILCATMYMIILD